MRMNKSHLIVIKDVFQLVWWHLHRYDTRGKLQISCWLLYLFMVKVFIYRLKYSENIIGYSLVQWKCVFIIDQLKSKQKKITSEIRKIWLEDYLIPNDQIRSIFNFFLIDVTFWYFDWTFPLKRMPLTWKYLISKGLKRKMWSFQWSFGLLLFHLIFSLSSRFEDERCSSNNGKKINSCQLSKTFLYCWAIENLNWEQNWLNDFFL